LSNLFVATIGRGEYVRLLLEDAGLDFEYVRFSAADWKEEKSKLLANKIPDPTMPYLTIDGKYYGKTVPLLRLISHKLNKYQGSNEEEAFLADAYCDIIMDWAGKWAVAMFENGKEDAIKTYKETTCADAINTFEAILSDTEGPYLLGKEVSYADFALYHLLEDDGSVIEASAHPHLAAFVQAIENRPNIKAYLATDRNLKN
jgi:glutathione S-transferase